MSLTKMIATKAMAVVVVESFVRVQIICWPLFTVEGCCGESCLTGIRFQYLNEIAPADRKSDGCC